MALQLCVKSDIEDWWSADGLLLRTDDDRSATENGSEASIVTSWIERSSAIVAAKLSQRYLQDAFAGVNPPVDTPVLVMHFTAVIASYWVAGRRNLPIPEQLKEEYDKVLKSLDEIAAGQSSLPGVADSFEGGFFLSNFHLDGRYRSAKFRVITATAVGSDPTGASIKRFPEQFSGQGFFL